ncbi:tRNA preQ1(34) S-adenosylmethionine ribosyltransferase-isomerase QueA [Rhodovarius crocodyli]|uniref:S-adenosylmethionine:tRNA ribosyltransferase-isomerase n=1 Tax=Rhodovarius crocodyli TaxID=1979269 RepID=A0A437MMI8_9PROT|nr:tRNA preQ1(34) S-adenosylmethionine ribosyltransferase-isomerase QueA [Rhodovarius crocodyli]RVT98870.1 tRNA preQ1(34) S-adenosylmethionine ribosyltransferase-isomerase QueA [Rhodovarius crocodyli]
MTLTAADFDYPLPDDRIAQHPARPRDAALLLDARAPALVDRGVLDLPALLEPGDLLVVNDTRVIPARLTARRGQARVEIMLNRAEGNGIWHALVRNARRLKAGDTVEIEGAPITARVVEDPAEGAVRLDFGPDEAALAAALDQAGEIPLPPYIQRAAGPEDEADYQTLFADRPGAVAAPTASLHFTPRLIEALEARGVRRATLTLHVGAGTFLPLRGDNPAEHKMHAEWGQITPETAALINETRARGRRIVAVGTTVLRLLETAATGDIAQPVRPFDGLTSIFLLPGHRFTTADLLMTNFHLPKSTLMMLVAGFAGLDHMRAVYAHALAGPYRFTSYGDSSLWARA